MPTAPAVVAFPTPVAQPTSTPPPTTWPQPCADIYDPALLPTFDLEIAPDVWDALRNDFATGAEVYRPATFVYEGTSYPQAMVRLRGNHSTCGQKMQFAISFDQIDSKGRFDGLRRLDLDHGGCKPLEERVALSFAREDLGLPTQCANNARLNVNGTYYGLFTNLEHQDQEFLKRNFEMHGGNLYKNGWELKNNSSHPDTSDVAKFWSADSVPALESLADVDEAVHEWAAERMSPAVDNYYSYGWNYYLYDHPTRGFLFLPNDWDQGLPTPGDWALDPMHPITQAPATMVLADPTWRSRYLDALDEAVAAYDSGNLQSRIDQWWTQVHQSAADDPFLSYSTSDDHPFEGVKSRIHKRANFVRGWLACERNPSGEDADGDGYAWCDECDDANPLVSPAATEICNGIDDNCNGIIDEGCPTPTPTASPSPSPTATADPTPSP